MLLADLLRQCRLRGDEHLLRPGGQCSAAAPVPDHVEHDDDHRRADDEHDAARWHDNDASWRRNDYYAWSAVSRLRLALEPGTR
jgi:hypothetical protein